MNVNIEITYGSSFSRGTQKGSFSLRGRTKEKVALEFWKQIQNEMSYHASLEKIVANGDQDITDAVLKLEEEEYRRKIEESDNLPF